VNIEKTLDPVRFAFRLPRLALDEPDGDFGVSDFGGVGCFSGVGSASGVGAASSFLLSSFFLGFFFFSLSACKFCL
jgi:hypothetical protein